MGKAIGLVDSLSLKIDSAVSFVSTMIGILEWKTIIKFVILFQYIFYVIETSYLRYHCRKSGKFEMVVMLPESKTRGVKES